MGGLLRGAFSNAARSEECCAWPASARHEDCALAHCPAACARSSACAASAFSRRPCADADDGLDRPGCRPHPSGEASSGSVKPASASPTAMRARPQGAFAHARPPVLPLPPVRNSPRHARNPHWRCTPAPARPSRRALGCGTWSAGWTSSRTLRLAGGEVQPPTPRRATRFPARPGGTGRDGRAIS